MNSLDVRYLRKILSYDPVSGKIHWKVREDRELSWNRKNAGREAGAKKSNGYLELKINGTNYKAHRVAWALHFGEFPKMFLDHKDRNRSNNSIENLREATPSQNATNIHRTDGKYPRGVSKVGAKFFSQIQYRGKREYLGIFKTLEEASEAYLTRAKVLHGEFKNPYGKPEC